MSLDTISLQEINVLLGLNNNWCSVVSLLEYLNYSKMNTNSFIIYNDICLYQPDGLHYMGNGDHFLLNHDLNYMAIYLLRGLPLDVPVREKNTTVTIKSLIGKSYIDEYSNKVLVDKWIKTYAITNRNTLHIITGNIPDVSTNIQSLILYLKSNNIPNGALAEAIYEYSSLIDTLFTHDLFSIMIYLINKEPYNKKLKDWYEFIINRLKKIERLNKSYYDIIVPQYKHIIQKLLELYLPSIYEMEDLHGIYTTLDIIDTNSLSVLGKSILQLPSLEEQGYVLGIPIHMFQVSPKIIIQKIKDLIHQGEEEYINKLIENNKSYFSTISMFEVDDTDIISGDSFYEYNSFDILPYVCNNKTYLYIRDEANILNEKMKDRFNTAINPIFLDVIIHRQTMAQNFDLGRASSIRDIFDRLKNKLPKEAPVSINKPISIIPFRNSLGGNNNSLFARASINTPGFSFSTTSNDGDIMNFFQSLLNNTL